jgi:hypothetical protein
MACQYLSCYNILMKMEKEMMTTCSMQSMGIMHTARRDLLRAEGTKSSLKICHSLAVVPSRPSSIALLAIDLQSRPHIVYVSRHQDDIGRRQ